VRVGNIFLQRKELLYVWLLLSNVLAQRIVLSALSSLYLALSTWHVLTLSGDIFNGNVRYRSFSCDDLGSPLSLVFPSVSSPGDKVVIGTQIDGNAQFFALAAICDTLL
jgi:hypothetical protein